MEQDSAHDPSKSKIEILPGATADLSQATYCLHHETHTIGNPLRWMLMKKYNNVILWSSRDILSNDLLFPTPALCCPSCDCPRCSAKSPQVEFCGYSMPHPSEPKLHLRIQMYVLRMNISERPLDNLSSLEALLEALDNLEQLVDVVGEAYDTSLKQGKYQTFSERL